MLLLLCTANKPKEGFVHVISNLLKILTNRDCKKIVQYFSVIMSSRTIDTRVILTLWLSANFSIVANASEIQADVQKFGDVTHIEFVGASDWTPSRQKDGNRFTITVPKLSQQSVIELKTLEDQYIKKVQIESGANDSSSITFVLNNNDIQAFDYLTDDPSKLIIDFFKSDPDKLKKNKTKKIAKLSKKGRKPASDYIIVADKSAPNLNASKPMSGVYDGSDPEYNRFKIKDYEIKESSIIASKQNFYIKFPMLNLKDNFLAKILEASPVYEIQAENNEENKKARLLVTLFNNKRRVVFLTTLQLFREEFPSSKYDEIINFMEADAFYGLWQEQKKLSDFETAMTKYRTLIHKYPASPLKERTLLLIAYSVMDRGDYLGAYTEFQRFVRDNKNSPYANQIKMSEVDSLIYLNRFQDAIELLNSIKADKEMGKYSIAASFRIGDAYFAMNEYEQATTQYEKSLKEYPEWQSQFPNAYYNTAEGLFWSGNYKKSLDSYIEFLKRFPSNPHDGYAMTRVGETLEILGAPEERATGAFLESIYRYKGSEGAGVANIRLLGYRIPNKTQKEIDEQINETEKFIKSSKLSRLNDFQKIILSDGYYKKKEFAKSLDILVKFYQQNPTSNNLDVFRKRIVKNLTEQVAIDVQNKNYLGAIKTYGKNTSSWLKNSDRLDLQYFIAQSFENTGVFNEAAKRYRQVLNKLYAIKGTPEEKEREIFEHLPTIAQVNLRLAETSYLLSDFSKAKDYLVAVPPESLIHEQEKIERVYLTSLIYEKMGQISTAIDFLKDLTETWKGQPANVSGVYLRLGKLQVQQKDYKSAEVCFDRILKMAEDTDVISDDTRFQALEAKSDLLLQTNKREEAIQSYKSLLTLYEKKLPVSAIRYKLGKVYYELGNTIEAERTWSPLALKPEAKFWNKLAQEQLAQAKWEDEYKKYVNRIPAMTNDKDIKGDKNESGKK